MATLTGVRGRYAALAVLNRGSIREVCLLGTLPEEGGVEEGHAVTWAGSSYRVIAAEAEGYVHLRPVESTGW